MIIRKVCGACPHVICMHDYLPELILYGKKQLNEICTAAAAIAVYRYTADVFKNRFQEMPG